MTTPRTPMTVSVRPTHPRHGEKSRIELYFDPGYKSGKLMVLELSADDALELAEQALSAVRIVRRVNEEKVGEDDAP